MTTERDQARNETKFLQTAMARQLEERREQDNRILSSLEQHQDLIKSQAMEIARLQADNERLLEENVRLSAKRSECIRRYPIAVWKEREPWWYADQAADIRSELTGGAVNDED